jgi:hypothetical protein
MTGEFRLWLVLSLFGFAPEALSAAQKQEVNNSLWIELCDTTGLDDSILQAARDEASIIFSTAGAQLRWEGGCDDVPRTTPQSARIHVVPRIQERLANLLYEHRGIRNVMGYSGSIDVHEGVQPNAGGKRVAVIYVARQAVEEVASTSKDGPITLTDTLLARSLGRVFAHELAHRFLGPEHTRNGILKDRLYQKDLIDLRNGGLFFSAEQIRLLRLRIAHGALAVDRR